LGTVRAYKPGRPSGAGAKPRAARSPGGRWGCPAGLPVGRPVCRNSP